MGSEKSERVSSTRLRARLRFEERGVEFCAERGLREAEARHAENASILRELLELREWEGRGPENCEHAREGEGWVYCSKDVYRRRGCDTPRAITCPNYERKEGGDQ